MPATPTDFFVLRRPLLPLSVWERAHEALAHDTAPDDVLRGVYQTHALLRDAVYFASPDVHQRLLAWLGSSDPVPERLQLTLYKYFVRASSRATPFGLLAGVSLGRWGEKTHFFFGENDSPRRHVRLDTRALHQLTDALNAHPRLRRQLRYQANPARYIAGGEIRYVHARYEANAPTYLLSAAPLPDWLDPVLRAAREGATLGELAATAQTTGLSDHAARRAVEALVAHQVLLPTHGFALTGGDGLTQWLEHLDGFVGAGRLRAEGRAVGALLQRGHPADCEAATRRLETLTGQAAPHPAVQADAWFANPSVRLGPAFRDQLTRLADALLPLARHPDVPALARFRQRFTDRYGEREVPLLEVLDPDLGVGYDAAPPLVPWLDEIAWPTAAEPAAADSRQPTLVRLYAEALAGGRRTVALTDADLAALRSSDAPTAWPPSAYLLGRILAEPGTSHTPWLYFVAAGGPSAANLLGRFAHLSPDLATVLRNHLDQEQEAYPADVLAEIIHLPEAGLGNVLQRPPLRGWEIPVVSRSALPLERQLPLDDLLVSVENGQRVVLHSRRLGRAVRPRLATAHNFTTGLAHYRFLCDLQTQDDALHVVWDWGALRTAPFLPRVNYHGVVLSRATWQTEAGRFDPKLPLEAQLRDWLARWNVPRRVVLTEADHELLLDLKNPLTPPLLAQALAQQRRLTLTEALLPEPGFCAFINEVVFPLENPRTPQSAPAKPVVNDTRRDVRRSFPPGSRWLYLKVYGGAAALDAYLRRYLPPLLERLRGTGLLEGWFFIRYADPAFHLRLRFRAVEGREADLLTAVAAWFDHPERSSEGFHNLQFATYERELERFGADTIDACERWFCAESDALLERLQNLSEGDDDARLHLACAEAFGLLRDWGLDLAEQTTRLETWRDEFGAEFGAEKSTYVSLDQLYRRRREALQAACLAPRPASDAATRALLAELRAAPTDLLPHLLHLRLNRLAVGEPRRQEFVVYALLYKLTRTLRATGQVSDETTAPG